MKQKNNQKAQELVISEEEKQNHPFVRSIAKKIRNINKKLLDIDALEKRDDLKPEQQEKINSKQATIDERKKFEDFIRFYRTTIAEAANDKEAKQVSPVFSKLGNSLVLAHYLSSGAQVDNINLNATEKTIVSNLANVGREQASLQELGAQLGGYFSEYLNNEKLVNKVETAFANEKIGGTRVNLYKKTETQTHSQVIIKQTPKKEQVQPTPIQETKAQEQPIQTTEHQVEEVRESSTVVVSEQQPKNETVNAVENTTQTKPQATGQVTKQGYKRGPQRDRPYKPYQGNKRPYKPRYNEKKQAGNDDESGEEQEQRSRFNNKEMRELENDGFIVIQKKQKPKDPKESESYYKKQHGYKEKKIHHNN